MDRDKILEQIKVNKLENLNYEFLISQLCVLNNKTYEDVQKIVDQLLFEKLITAQDVPVKEVMEEKKQPKVSRYAFLLFFFFAYFK